MERSQLATAAGEVDRVPHEEAPAEYASTILDSIMAN
jgi:hypothetical protein